MSRKIKESLCHFEGVDSESTELLLSVDLFIVRGSFKEYSTLNSERKYHLLRELGLCDVPRVVQESCVDNVSTYLCQLLVRVPMSPFVILSVQSRGGYVSIIHRFRLKTRSNLVK